jgi:lysozyme family protein
MITFDEAFDRIIGHEGGYSNRSVAADPGGETNWGISKREYPHLDIKNLTREQAKQIYRRDFWNKLGADTLYDGVVFQLFDFAINSGLGTAIRQFQRAIGVAEDGDFGKHSREVAAKYSESDQIFLILSARLEYMTRLKNWDPNSRGWARRIAADMRYAVQDS